MRDLTLAEMAYQNAHVAVELGVANLKKNYCHNYKLCTCGELFCAKGVDRCDTCRLQKDIIITLEEEFDVKISPHQAAEGVKLFDRKELGPFFEWISKFHPLAPLAYA